MQLKLLLLCYYQYLFIATFDIINVWGSFVILFGVAHPQNVDTQSDTCQQIVP